MTQISIKWGLELEYASKFDFGYLKEGFKQRAEQEAPNIRIGTDSSADDDENGYPQGLEFRTITPWSQFPSAEIKLLMDFVKQKELKVGTTCGLHLHFSGLKLTPEEFRWLYGKLEATHWWQARKEWICRNKNYNREGFGSYSTPYIRYSRLMSGGRSRPRTDRDHRLNRYQPLREVNDWQCESHYEARVFNSTREFHGVYQPWKFLRKLLMEIVSKR